MPDGERLRPADVLAQTVPPAHGRRSVLLLETMELPSTIGHHSQREPMYEYKVDPKILPRGGYKALRRQHRQQQVPAHRHASGSRVYWTAMRRLLQSATPPVGIL